MKTITMTLTRGPHKATCTMRYHFDDHATRPVKWRGDVKEILRGGHPQQNTLGSLTRLERNIKDLEEEHNCTITLEQEGEAIPYHDYQDCFPCHPISDDTPPPPHEHPTKNQKRRHHPRPAPPPRRLQRQPKAPRPRRHGPAARQPQQTRL